MYVCYAVQAETRATEAERTVSKLQKEVDRLEGKHCGVTVKVTGSRLKVVMVHSCVACYICPQKSLIVEVKIRKCTVCESVLTCCDK